MLVKLVDLCTSYTVRNSQVSLSNQIFAAIIKQLVWITGSKLVYIFLNDDMQI